MKINNINGYKKWDKTPNTIINGATVLTKTFHVEVKNKDKDRLVRVYLPSTYDVNNPNKRFPVIYMMDGKNLFDDYTSYVGEWGIDETIEEAISQNKCEGIIVVGIDSAKTNYGRASEMTPSDIVLKKRVKQEFSEGYAEILGNFIFDELKKDIDKTFYTLPDKNHTGVGGSSMGGLMAYFLYHKYRQYVGYSFSFSPAFFLFIQKSFKESLLRDVPNKNDLGKIYFYVGGVGFESYFVSATKKTYQYFKDLGFKDDEVFLKIDESQEHNEKAWRKYFPEALEYFNYLK